MTLRRYLYTMLATTLICWMAFFIVILRIDPNSAGSIGLLLFFFSLFFAIWGTFGIIGFGIRYLVKHEEAPFEHIGISLRQALWFAILVCLTLFLVSQELLIWWMSILLVLALSVLEGFFMSRSVQTRRALKQQKSTKSV